MPFNIPLRARKSSDNGEFSIDRRGISRWLRELEGVDRRERSRRLVDGIKHINRLDIPARRRLAIMEELRPVTREMLDYLASRVHSQSLPLPEQARTVYDRNIELLCESALGYVIVVRTEGAGGRRKSIALAAERALARNGEWMLRAAQIYTGIPLAFWHTIHTVYATAEKADVATRRVDAPEAANSRARQSPASIYKRILLFALAETEGMRRGEAERIYRGLGEWAELAELGTEDEVSMPTRFAVDLESPRPPMPPEQMTLSGDSRLRILGVDGVVERIVELERAAPPEDAPPTDSSQLRASTLRRLIDSWHPFSHDRSERSYRGEEVDAEVSLPVIQARLGKEYEPKDQSEDQGESRRARLSGAALTLQTIDSNEIEAAPASAPADDRWREIGRGQRRSAAYDAARRMEARLDQEGALPEHPRWLLADVSASGYRLIWDTRGGSRAAVGELVALRLADDEGADDTGVGRWEVGVIRRMRFIDDSRFEIGAHTLSDHPLPGRVRREPENPNRKRDRSKEPSEPVIVLRGREDEAVAPIVITPAHMFRSGEVLELELPDRYVRIRLGTIQENTGAIGAYEIRSAPPRGRRAARPGEGDQSEGEDAPIV